MSTLEVSNLNDGTTTVGTTFITNGSAKGYALIDQTAPAIDASFNTSSLTDTSAGKGSINWTNAMSGALVYSCVTNNLNVAASTPYTATVTADRHYVTQTASAWPFRSVYANETASAYFDPDGAMIVSHGDLA